MANVEEVRAGISSGNGKMQESLAAIQQAKELLQEAQNSYVGATQGSNDQEMQQASGMVAELIEQLTGVQGTIEAATGTAEAYSARL